MINYKSPKIEFPLLSLRLPVIRAVNSSHKLIISFQPTHIALLLLYLRHQSAEEYSLNNKTMPKQPEGYRPANKNADPKADRHKTRHQCNAYGCPRVFLDHWKLMMHMYAKHRELLSDCELHQYGERARPKGECARCGKVLLQMGMNEHLKICKGPQKAGLRARK